MTNTEDLLEYREKLWVEGETEIYLNKDETNSFYKIMFHFLGDEIEHFQECVEDGINVENHILYHFVNVINGLPQNLKEEIVSWVEEVVDKDFWNKVLETLEVV